MTGTWMPQVGDRVVPSAKAGTTILSGVSAPDHRRPTVGKTIGTVLGKPGYSSTYWRVQWDPDEGGHFPVGPIAEDHSPTRQYTSSQLEWLLTSSEMEKIVPTTNTELDLYKARVKDVAARAKRGHPGKAVHIDEILNTLGVTTGPREPKKGSVVRHPTMSITYTRPWGFPTDGGRNWRCSDKTYQTSSELPWTEVVRLCGGAPVVLLDTNGDIDYTDADIRHNVKAAQA